jgi:hypothetical protein
VHLDVEEVPREWADTPVSRALVAVEVEPPQAVVVPVQVTAAVTADVLTGPDTVATSSIAGRSLTSVTASVVQFAPAPRTVQLAVPPLLRATSPVAAPEVAPVIAPVQVVASQLTSEPPELFATPSRVPATVPATVVTSESACERQSPEVIVQREVVVVARTGTGLPATATPRTAPRTAVSVVPLHASSRQSTVASALLDRTPLT